MPITKNETGFKLDPIVAVMGHLRRFDDVDGSALIRSDGSVIVMDLPLEIDADRGIMNLFRKLAFGDEEAFRRSSFGMFTQVVTPYNGFKVLAGPVNKDLIFVLLVKSRGYIGVAMLDIENSIREIRKILLESDSLV